MRETNLHYADLNRKEIARKAGKSDTGKNQEKPDTMSGANTHHQTPCDGAIALLPAGSRGAALGTRLHLAPEAVANSHLRRQTNSYSRPRAWVAVLIPHFLGAAKEGICAVRFCSRKWVLPPQAGGGEFPKHMNQLQCPNSQRKRNVQQRAIFEMT